MPNQKRTVVELTEEEYKRHLRDAATMAVRQALSRDTSDELDRRSRVEVGLVTLADIADLYGVTEETARRWVADLEPVNPNRNKHLYRTDELPEKL
jgi:hypothetical protein